MKNKKQSEGAHNNRYPSSHKGQGLTKRGNKENYIQMTEPLDANHQTYPSKEFILSRESVSQGSKSVLKDISNGKRQQRCQQTAAKAEKSQRSQEGVFDRRLSLKCTGNYSQQLDYQKSQRLSMAPLRR